MNKQKPWPALASIIPTILMVIGGIVFLVNQISLLLLFRKLKDKKKPKTKK